MSANSIPLRPAQSGAEQSLSLRHVARFPGLRALLWNEDVLYAARGYELLRARITPATTETIIWQPVANFRPPLLRSITAATRLTARLLRDGFHALAALPNAALIAAVPGAIVSLAPGESEFRVTHKIVRGTRPLHITATPTGAIYWGEYFDNASRSEVHIYASLDSGHHWDVAHTFPAGAIRHVHNIVYDPYQNCLWILTGDYGDECRILRASCDLQQIDAVMQGNQQARAVAMLPSRDGIYFSSDTPLEKNYIYHLDRKGNLRQLAPIAGSSIYGCRVGENIFFSTMVEPSAANPDQYVRLYGSDSGQSWQPLLAWQKDFWPMKYFQYGNAFLPDGHNRTHCLALTTIAVRGYDMCTSLYAVTP